MTTRDVSCDRRDFLRTTAGTLALLMSERGLQAKAIVDYRQLLDAADVEKGHAIDAAVAILRGHGVSRALIHGGTSSVHGIGVSPGDAGWRIGWQPPGGTREFVQLQDRW